MQSAPRPTALVTGASSGLGADFAALLARDGYDLVLVARSAPAMEALAARAHAEHGTTTHVLSIDLAKPGATAEVTRALAERGLEVDVLINNAGFGDNAIVAEADAAVLTGMTQLNVTTLTDLTRAVLPGMIARRRGRVMLLGSTAAFQPGPHMAVYCATKAYVLSFGEALAYELRGTGVTATTVCPGATATGFQLASGLNLDTPLVKSGMMTSAEVARQGYAAMKLGTPVIVTGIPNLVSATMGRHLPHFLSLPIAARLLGK